MAGIRTGTGTTFYFKIPLVYSELTAGTEKKDAGEYVGDPGSIKILLAEDDEVSYLYLKEIMTGCGIELLWAQNGVQAVQICSDEKDLDLVLMDIKMPDMNGIEATEKIREIRPDLPVIAVTAFAKNEDRLTALSAGCNEFLSKPIKREDLMAVLTRHSNRTHPKTDGMTQQKPGRILNPARLVVLTLTVIMLLMYYFNCFSYLFCLSLISGFFKQGKHIPFICLYTRLIERINPKEVTTYPASLLEEVHQLTKIICVKFGYYYPYIRYSAFNMRQYSANFSHFIHLVDPFAGNIIQSVQVIFFFRYA
jgi:CheY-like chemotaxis protein